MKLAKIGIVLFTTYYGIIALIGILLEENVFNNFIPIGVIFGSFLLMMLLTYLSRRLKKWTPEILEILERQGFTLIEECPTNFEETLLYGMPIKAFGKMIFSTRILTVKDGETERIFCAYITRPKIDGKVKLEIVAELKKNS